MNHPLSSPALSLFLEYAKDAENWNGQPLVGGNVSTSAENKGHLTKLKVAGLIVTFPCDGCLWLDFTPAGKALALDHGISI
jgi:hypothetical protein